MTDDRKTHNAADESATKQPAPPQSGARGEGNGARAYSKEDIQKIIEDPYFKYLVDKTARAQTWAFLAAIGSVIAIILLYAGLEFKSAKSEIDKARKNIADDVVASQQETEKVKKNSQEAQSAVGSAQAQLAAAGGLFSTAQKNGEDSQRMALAIIQAAQAQINSASSLNQGFLQSQRGLLDSASKTTEQANESVKGIQTTLAELKNAKISEKLKQVEAELRDVNTAKENAETARMQAETASRQVASQVNSLRSLENVNLELTKARASESITLRAHQSYLLQMPDLARLSADPNSQSYLWVTFKVDGLGKHFDLYWKVQDGEGTEVSSGTQRVKAPGKKAALSQAPFPLTNTPYEVVVEFSNYGIFAHDFVVLKVKPKSKVTPRIMETSNTTSDR